MAHPSTTALAQPNSVSGPVAPTPAYRHPLGRGAVGALALLSVVLLAGCGQADSEAWLPLDKGHSQTYRVTETGEEWGEAGAPVASWTIATEGSTQLNGSTVWMRRHSEGVTFYLKRDDSGIRRVAYRTDIDETPTEDPEPRWVLKAPYTVGTEWTTPTVPYLLRRKNEHPRELKHTHKALMTWRIEAVDDEVTTPKGTHKPCLRVVGVAELNLFTDPVNGFHNVPLVGREWYCKGVGLVKFEREEAVPKGFMTGGKLVAEWEE